MDAQARERPRFKASVQPVVSPDDGLFLLQEGCDEWLSHAVFSDLAPLLDGKHGIEDIFSQLSGLHSSATILSALKELERRDVLAEDASDLPAPVLAFWERAGVAPGQAVLRIPQMRVALKTLGNLPTDEITDLLKRQGLAVSPLGDLTLVIVDDYLDAALPDINAKAMNSGQPWLMVKPTGTETWIGPAITPGQSACWECLAHRLRWHRRVERYALEGNPRSKARQEGYLPSTVLASIAEAATEITRWIGTRTLSPLENCVVSTNHLTFARSRHPLIRRPQCPACGISAPVGRPPKPVLLQSRPKIATSDGGNRGSDPEETARRLERHFSPITGVIGALEPSVRSSPPAHGARWLTPTFSADHNFSDMHDERFVLHDGMRRRSGGKGKTMAQARASALAESLERYCGVFDGTEPRIRSVFADLGPSAIWPNDYMLFSDRQYAERERHNLKDHKAHWVPEPFNSDTQIDWTPLWSLTDERVRYLPTSMCYFGYRGSDPMFGRGDSNGCALGSVLEEAILQGLLELVERDAVALWWYNRVPRAGVDLSTSDDPYIAELVAHYASLYRSLWVLDVTSDLGIPTFAALSKRTDKPEQDIIYGFGCHLDPAVALTRAVTEINQSLDAVPAFHQPQTKNSYLGLQEAVAWWRTVRTENHGYLAPDPVLTPVDIRNIASQATDDLARDIINCVERLKSAGIEVLVLDQSRPDIEFPAVRVIAPGLRHFWARFGPGRLYDVPVKLGWLKRPKSEAELNTNVVQF